MTEKQHETFRIRKVNLYFYLEDDTFQINESKTENSGFPQGNFIRRTKIQNPKAREGQHLVATDLNVGQELVILSRTFTLTGCDDFTRKFLSEHKISVPQNLGFPRDSHTESREELASRMKQQKNYTPQLNLRQFLDHDRQVLRFYSVWDDSHSMYGFIHKAEIHYFLADDTIEVIEHFDKASGNEHSSVFMKKGRLPKTAHELNKIVSKEECYGISDFVLGGIINLYGRPFIITGCDAYTKNFYSKTMDPACFDEIAYEREETTLPSTKPRDIERSHVGLPGQKVLAPLTDVAQSRTYDGISLRFSAKLNSADEFESSRRFVISLYLSDNSLSIFEQARPGSSVGGKFLEKGQVRKYPELEFYTSFDFFIGKSPRFICNEAQN